MSLVYSRMNETMQTIRICYIIPLLDGLKTWGKLTRELQEAVAGPDVEITLVDLPDAPVTSIMSEYHSELVAPLCIQAVIKAEQAGYHAVGIACLREPGLTGAKEAVKIPVVGDMEAAIHLASLVGRRFSLLLPGSSAGRLQGADASASLEDLVRKYGLIHKLASMRSVAAKSLDFTKSNHPLAEEMLTEAQRAVEEDGADVVISYGGIDVLNTLRGSLTVPVIDPVQAFTIMAESLVRLGISQSKRTFPKPYDLERPGSRGAGHNQSLTRRDRE